MVRALRVAFADFSTAPWRGLEKSERCPNNSSLFRPQAAVVVVAVQVLAALNIEKGAIALVSILVQQPFLFVGHLHRL